MTNKIDSGLPPPARTGELGGAAQAGQAKAGEDRSQPVGAVPSADSLRLTGEAAGLQALQRELAGPADIDLNRVNEVRAALADGSYRIDPEQIASRMLALESELGQ